MSKDSSEVVKHYNKCQRFDKVMTNPPKELSQVLAPWPFAQWGVDLIGYLPVRKGGCKFVVVAVDYFMKWTETETSSICSKNPSSLPLPFHEHPLTEIAGPQESWKTFDNVTLKYESNEVPPLF
jgi:hypothetical protein